MPRDREGKELTRKTSLGKLGDTVLVITDNKLHTSGLQRKLTPLLPISLLIIDIKAVNMVWVPQELTASWLYVFLTPPASYQHR